MCMGWSWAKTRTNGPSSISIESKPFQRIPQNEFLRKSSRQTHEKGCVARIAWNDACTFTLNRFLYQSFLPNFPSCFLFYHHLFLRHPPQFHTMRLHVVFPPCQLDHEIPRPCNVTCSRSTLDHDGHTPSPLVSLTHSLSSLFLTQTQTRRHTIALSCSISLTRTSTRPFNLARSIPLVPVHALSFPVTHTRSVNLSRSPSLSLESPLGRPRGRHLPTWWW